MSAAVVAIVMVVAKQHYATSNYEHDRRVWCDSGAPTAEQKASCPDEGPQRKEYLPWWYVLVTWPEGIQTWAIIATGAVVAWQSFESRRAASASMKQARLQEAGMRQWVELDGWSSSEQFPGGVFIKVDFSVSNPTNFLITLQHGAFSIQSDPPVHSTFIYRPAPLAPQKPLSTAIAFPVTPEKMQNFMNGTIGVSINGSIQFESALGMTFSQNFEGVLSCRLGSSIMEAVVSLTELKPSKTRET